MHTPIRDNRLPVATADTLLLFGASGDLALRMLLPSLYGLHGDRLLPETLKIVGLSRREMDTDAFRAMAADALKRFLPAEEFIPAQVDTFLKRLDYAAVDITRQDSFTRLRHIAGARPDGTTAIFLSTAPSLYAAAIDGLQKAGLTGNAANNRVRLALEKPLGDDLTSSRLINDAVQAAFSEDKIFRIDHYLGKETVQNLLALRFANMLFEPLWNADSIDHVQITVAETVGLEGRGEFYDHMGALRDMVQNHMLQLLALVAMEPPAHFNATAIRDEKVKVLRALRPIDRQNVRAQTVLGQYSPGALAHQAVPGYTEDLNAPSNTETFVALKAFVDNWRWKGVPFYLRTGKRLPVRQSEILVQFKPVPHCIFSSADGALSANKLVIRLQPQEYIRLLVMVKEPGLDEGGVRLREVPLDLSLTTAFAHQRRRIAYERLLLDFIHGDPTLFVRRDEVEAQWQWIDAIRDGWAHRNMKPEPYPAGSWGPPQAQALVEQDGVRWHD